MVLRADKGSELTHAELDNNFLELETLITSPHDVSVLASGEEAELSIFEFLNFNTAGIDFSKPIAFVSIQGTVAKYDDDGYGNYSIDGYGNLGVSNIAVHSVLPVFLNDDGYGNITVADLSMAEFYQDYKDNGLYLCCNNPSTINNLFDLRVKVYPKIDFITAGINLVVGVD